MEEGEMAAASDELTVGGGEGEEVAKSGRGGLGAGVGAATTGVVDYSQATR